MQSEKIERLYGYKFYIPDEARSVKPFINCDDRRVAAIQKSFQSEICLTRDTCIRKGQKARAVLVRARNRRILEACLRRIDETFPDLFACANLRNATSTLQMIELKKYFTNEDLSTAFTPDSITYYQLTFYLDSGEMSTYEYWRKTTDALRIKKLGCVLLVSLKDSSGAGFLRRYALISGEDRKNVIEAFRIFRETFASLPVFDEDR